MKNHQIISCNPKNFKIQKTVSQKNKIKRKRAKFLKPSIRTLDPRKNLTHQ